jgi:opacity protein-like surface antigen
VKSDIRRIQVSVRSPNPTEKETTMRKLLLMTLLTIACVSQAAGQTAPRWDFNFTLSHALQEPTLSRLNGNDGGESFTIEPCTADGIDALGANLSHILCDRRDFHGFNLGAKYNLSPTLGIRTDFSAYFNKDRAIDSFGTGVDAHTDTSSYRERTYVLVSGLEARRDFGAWRPYAHVMAGVARVTQEDTETSTGPFEFVLQDRATSLALKIGGGIDVRISPRVDLRLIEIDYQPVFARDRHTPVTGQFVFDQSVKGKTAGNVTFGVGLVWH